MKEAPDKIYIPIIEEDGKRLLCTNWWEVDTSPQNAYVNETIPYIRKDALLEWLEQNRTQAQMWFDKYATHDDLVAKQVWEEVIDKLNEM